MKNKIGTAKKNLLSRTRSVDLSRDASDISQGRLAAKSEARTDNPDFVLPAQTQKYSNITGYNGYIHKHTCTSTRAPVKPRNEACNYACNVTGR